MLFGSILFGQRAVYNRADTCIKYTMPGGSCLQTLCQQRWIDIARNTVYAGIDRHIVAEQCPDPLLLRGDGMCSHYKTDSVLKY